MVFRGLTRIPGPNHTAHAPPFFCLPTKKGHNGRKKCFVLGQVDYPKSKVDEFTGGSTKTIAAFGGSIKGNGGNLKRGPLKKTHPLGTSWTPFKLTPLGHGVKVGGACCAWNSKVKAVLRNWVGDRVPLQSQIGVFDPRSSSIGSNHSVLYSTNNIEWWFPCLGPPVERLESGYSFCS